MKRIIFFILLGILNLNYTYAKTPKVNGLYAIQDEFSSDVLYKRSLHFDVSKSGFELYIIGRKNGSFDLYARIGYRGYDWIFFDEAKLLCEFIPGEPIIENILFNKYDKHEDVVTDVQSIKCQEYVDVLVDKDLLDMLEIIVDRNQGKIRVQGSHGSHTETFTSKWISHINLVLSAYHAFVNEK